jgi:DNA-binding HxlR family transcriptional regulator
MAGTLSMPERTDMQLQLFDPESDQCRAARAVLGCVGDKWSIIIIVLLGPGPKRFNAIKRTVGGISQRVLTLTLRELERNGLLTRTEFPSTPRGVQYELTDLGRSLRDTVEPLSTWARVNSKHIRSAQMDFERKQRDNGSAS